MLVDPCISNGLCCYVWKLGFMSLLCLGNHDDDTPGDLVVSVYEYMVGGVMM